MADPGGERRRKSGEVDLWEQLQEFHAANEEQEQQLLIAAEVGRTLLGEKEALGSELAEVQEENHQLGQRVQEMDEVGTLAGRWCLLPATADAPPPPLTRPAAQRLRAKDEAIRRCHDEAATLRNIAEQARTSCRREQAEVAALRSREEEQARRLRELEDWRDELHERERAAEEEARSTAGRLARVAESDASAQGEASELRRRLAEAQRHLSEAEKALAAVRAERDAALRAVEAASEESCGLRQQVGQLVDARLAADQCANSLREELQRVRSEAEEAWAQAEEYRGYFAEAQDLVVNTQHAMARGRGDSVLAEGGAATPREESPVPGPAAAGGGPPLTGERLEALLLSRTSSSSSVDPGHGAGSGLSAESAAAAAAKPRGRANSAVSQARSRPRALSNVSAGAEVSAGAALGARDRALAFADSQRGDPRGFLTASRRSLRLLQPAGMGKGEEAEPGGGGEVIEEASPAGGTARRQWQAAAAGAGGSAVAELGGDDGGGGVEASVAGGGSSSSSLHSEERSRTVDPEYFHFKMTAMWAKLKLMEQDFDEELLNGVSVDAMYAKCRRQSVQVHRWPDWIRAEITRGYVAGAAKAGVAGPGDGSGALHVDTEADGVGSPRRNASLDFLVSLGRRRASLPAGGVIRTPGGSAAIQSQRKRASKKGKLTPWTMFLDQFRSSRQDRGGAAAAGDGSVAERQAALEGIEHIAEPESAQAEGSSQGRSSAED